jgi:hypothetical protein
MIGTIRPSRKALECFGLRNEITTAMCHTCNAVGKWLGQPARLGLSHDAIFLGLFSRSDLFRSAPLRKRPFRCVTNSKDLTCPDAGYLAAATVFTFATKYTDAIADGEIPVRGWISRRIGSMNSVAELQLLKLGLPVETVKADLGKYRQLEQRRTKAPFETIAEPIANAYGTLFAHLPSQADDLSQQAKLREIGSSYGELTLLVDAVEDAEEDHKLSRFNAWRAGCDLPSDRPDIRADISRRFGDLIARVSSQCTKAADYLRAAHEATLERLCGRPRTSARLFSHPSTVMLAGLNCCEQDCNGNTSVTPTEMFITVVVGAACIGCCCCNKS